jgi:hypothetical protein
MVVQPPRWFVDEPDLSPFLKALDDVRRKATREGWRYWHVQAIIVAIDQCAEAATGNREYFLNKPHSIGGVGRAATFLSLLGCGPIFFVQAARYNLEVVIR